MRLITVFKTYHVFGLHKKAPPRGKAGRVSQCLGADTLFLACRCWRMCLWPFFLLRPFRAAIKEGHWDVAWDGRGADHGTTLPGHRRATAEELRFQRCLGIKMGDPQLPGFPFRAAWSLDGEALGFFIFVMTLRILILILPFFRLIQATYFYRSPGMGWQKQLRATSGRLREKGDAAGELLEMNSRDLRNLVV